MKYLREIDELAATLKMRLNSQGVVKSHLLSHLKLGANADIPGLHPLMF